MSSGGPLVVRVALVLAFGAAVFSGCAHARPASWCSIPVRLEVPAEAPTKGPLRPGVLVIQEAGDFQCPYCQRVQPTVKKILRVYEGRVRLVWRHYPLPSHLEAMLAAEAASEVRAQGGDEKFWAYHDVLFANQGALMHEDLEGYARDLGGIDMVRFRRALDQHVHRPAIEADILAVRKAGAGDVGAPAFFFGEGVLEGAQPFEVFQSAIDAELRR